MNNKYLVWFNEVDKRDLALVGGKAANLGEMKKAGFPVPDGFVVTSLAYDYFIKTNNLQDQIKSLLKNIDSNDPRQLDYTSKKIKALIIKSPIPKDLCREIIKYYDKLSGYLSHSLVAIRSSATAEDLPDASFAGQQETFLNIRGEANVINKIREAWASLFTPRAIFYRIQKKFSHFKLSLAVPVQKMVQSEISGIMFTIDPVNNNKSNIIIEAIWGLGELIVQGTVTPDHYEVNKNSFEIISKQISRQFIQLVKKGNENLEVKVKKDLQNKQKLINSQIINIAKLGKKIHQHYFFPQDIEWAIEKNKLYIVQSRPITTIKNIENEKANKTVYDFHKLTLITKGSPASPGIGSGPARIIKSPKEIYKINNGDILVTEMTTPDYVPAMKKANAIVTDKGGRVSHAAIVSRELGIPCVVGTENATKLIKNEMVITVNGTLGEIYKGAISKQSNTITATNPYHAILKHVSTKTRVYVNLGEPDLANDIARRNVDGVGLLRAEFMISQSIGIHPKKLIKDHKENLFIEKLADGLKTFCEAFGPRPVVYRTTDFKTNEYRNLTGGQEYEPNEPNPMLGFRGGYRYIKDEKIFKLELEAIKRVRNKYLCKNLWLMIPFVRTVNELIMIKKIINDQGLTRSSTFKLWMMVEIPSNVILLQEFIDVGIDGISIGSNDLTMLILGIDRDNDLVAPEFNENDPAVLWALQKVITICKKNHITSSICGQAPSVYPDLAKKLVDWGITSISVSPDAIDQTRKIIKNIETSA